MVSGVTGGLMAGKLGERRIAGGLKHAIILRSWDMRYSSLQFRQIGCENMRKLYRNKKGLSTVISTILMIVVVMVGMTLLFAYVTVYASNYQTGIGSSILESVTIEDVWIQNSNTVQLTVYNTGTATNLGTNA